MLPFVYDNNDADTDADDDDMYILIVLAQLCLTAVPKTLLLRVEGGTRL